MCYQTQESKDRMGVFTAVSFPSDKSLCFKLIKGKTIACERTTRNELNKLLFHICNNCLTKQLLVVVVIREFPRWIILIITIMKLGWGKGKWVFLNPIPLLCWATAEEITCFKRIWANQQNNYCSVADNTWFAIEYGTKGESFFGPPCLLAGFHCEVSCPFRGRLPGSSVSLGLFCCCQEHTFWWTVEICLLFQFRSSLNNSGMSN